MGPPRLQGSEPVQPRKATRDKEEATDIVALQTPHRAKAHPTKPCPSSRPTGPWETMTMAAVKPQGCRVPDDQQAAGKRGPQGRALPGLRRGTRSPWQGGHRGGTRRTGTTPHRRPSPPARRRGQERGRVGGPGRLAWPHHLAGTRTAPGACSCDTLCPVRTSVKSQHVNSESGDLCEVNF